MKTTFLSICQLSWSLWLNETMENYNYQYELPKETLLDVNGISIRLYVVEDSIWLFDNRQVADNYGISEATVRSHLKNNENILIEGKHWFKKQGWKPPNYPHFNLWTKEGFVTVGNFIKTSEANTLLIALGIKSKQVTKIESQLVEIIKNTFRDITKIESNFPVSGYFADIYFPDINTIVEIDERGHKGYDMYDELSREDSIRESLNCEIIRFNPHDIHDNVGNIINKLLKKIMKTPFLD